MQIPMWLIRALKSGEVSLFTDGMKTLELKAENKKIDVNLLSKELLTDILRVGVETKGKSIPSTITQLKNVAEKLRRDGLTVTVSHEGCIVLTLGSGAKPTLSQLVTRTNAIEINNLSRLIRLLHS